MLLSFTPPFCFRPLIGVIISNMGFLNIIQTNDNRFRPLIGVIISNLYYENFIVKHIIVSVPLSGLSFLISSLSALAATPVGFRPLIGVIISNRDTYMQEENVNSFRPLIGVIISNKYGSI